MIELLELFPIRAVPPIVSWLLFCNVLDVVTGFIQALDTKNISSKKMKHGAYSKIIIWIVVFVSYVASSYFGTDITTYVCGYYILMEIVSILENASKFVPIPEKLKAFLETNNKEDDIEKE